jgi:thiamine-phosphate pyrophosphorylase
MQFTLPPIYPITDKKLANSANHLSILKELVRGGAKFVQIRDKSTPVQELLRDLRQCVEFAQKKDVILVVNDRCDLVLSSSAMGVHLGQEDLPPAVARTVLGEEKIIGLSTHSVGQVQKSAGLPIQYIGFGPIYATATKDSAHPAIGLQRLALACERSTLPVVAIGGIEIEQVPGILKAGASSVAVISSLMRAENLASRMHQFLEKSMGK